MTHFANESQLVHDFPVKGHGTTVKAGDVLRVFDGPFSYAVVLGFSPEGDVKLSRPYVYASSVGTTCCSPLLGAETYTMTAANLRHVLTTFGGVHGDGRVVR